MTQQGDPWGSSEYPQQGYGQNYPPGQPPQFQPYQQQYGQPGSGFPPPQPPYQQPYQQPYPPQYPPQYRPPRRRVGRGIGIGCGSLVALVVLIAVIAGAHSSSSSSAPPVTLPTIPTVAVSQAAAPASSAAAAQTVTYEVSGSQANVTYGPAGSNAQGSVPMDVTKQLGTPIYVAITAQLQGSGTVTCKIKVDGKVISQSTASGGYNIAQCEISQNPLSGQWEDTNG
jgi:hypothetical protein